ncbi:hypothetical protein E2C01_046317 [Portunus trituberculatus]|uniref:Uncharacterized protein n=1 Tax=Portunus trituberculatus TaxID=210409 RepID=A0A5B7G4J6_PORTR|nr:hypothetical protein [Portunus trituberculatus]
MTPESLGLPTVGVEQSRGERYGSTTPPELLLRDSFCAPISSSSVPGITQISISVNHCVFG